MAANVTYTVNDTDSINLLDNIYSYAKNLVIKNETEALAGNFTDSEVKFAVLDKLITETNESSNSNSTYKITCAENSPIIKIPIQTIVKYSKDSNGNTVAEFIDPQYSILLENPSNLVEGTKIYSWHVSNGTIEEQFLDFAKDREMSDSFLCYHDNNSYYGDLQQGKSINPYFARKAQDFSILGYFNQEYTLNSLDTVKVVNWIPVELNNGTNNETVILYFRFKRSEAITNNGNLVGNITDYVVVAYTGKDENGDDNQIKANKIGNAYEIKCGVKKYTLKLGNTFDTYWLYNDQNVKVYEIDIDSNFSYGLNLVPSITATKISTGAQEKKNTWALIYDMFKTSYFASNKTIVPQLVFDTANSRTLKLLEFISGYGTRSAITDNSVTINYLSDIGEYGNSITYFFNIIPDNESDLNKISTDIQSKTKYSDAIDGTIEYNKSLSYITSSFTEANATRFREIYEESLNYFNSVLYSLAFVGESNYRSFVGLYIINASLQKYIAGETANLSNIEILDEATIKKYLRSYGLSAVVDTGIFMNKLEYLRLLLNNINDLITTRGSKASIDLIKNMFKAAALSIKRYIAVKSTDTEGKPIVYIISIDYDEDRNLNYVIRNSGYTPYDEFIAKSGDASGMFLSENELKDIDFSYVATKYLSFSIEADIKNNSDALSYLSSLFLNDESMYSLNDLKLDSQITVDGLIIPPNTPLSDLIKGMFQVYLFYNSNTLSVNGDANFTDLYVTPEKVIYVKKVGNYYKIPSKLSSQNAPTNINGLSIRNSQLSDAPYLLMHQLDSVYCEDDNNVNRLVTTNNRIAKLKVINANDELDESIKNSTLIYNNNVISVDDDGYTENISLDISGSKLKVKVVNAVTPSGNYLSRYITAAYDSTWRIYILDPILRPASGDIYAQVEDHIEPIYTNGLTETKAITEIFNYTQNTNSSTLYITKTGSLVKTYGKRIGDINNNNIYVVKYDQELYSISVAKDSTTGTTALTQTEFIELNNLSEVSNIENLLNHRTFYSLNSGSDALIKVEEVLFDISFRETQNPLPDEIFINNNRYLGLNSSILYDENSGNKSYNTKELGNILTNINLIPQELEINNFSFTPGEYDQTKDYFLGYINTDMFQLDQISELSIKINNEYKQINYIPVYNDETNLFMFVNNSGVNFSEYLNDSFDLYGIFRGSKIETPVQLNGVILKITDNAKSNNIISVKQNIKFVSDCIKLLTSSQDSESWPSDINGDPYDLYAIIQRGLINQLDATTLIKVNEEFVTLFGSEFSFISDVNSVQNKTDLTTEYLNFNKIIAKLIYHLTVRSDLFDSKNNPSIAAASQYNSIGDSSFNAIVANVGNPFNYLKNILQYRIDLPHIFSGNRDDKDYVYANSKNILDLLKVLFVYSTSYGVNLSASNTLSDVQEYVQFSLIDGINKLNPVAKSIVGTAFDIASPTAPSIKPTLGNDWRTRTLFFIRDYLEKMIYSAQYKTDIALDAKWFFYRYFTRIIDYLELNNSKWDFAQSIKCTNTELQDNISAYLNNNATDKQKVLGMAEQFLQVLIEVYSTLDSDVFVDIKSSSMVDATETMEFIKLLINYFKSYTTYLKSSEIQPVINSERERVYLHDGISASTILNIQDNTDGDFGISSFRFGEKISIEKVTQNNS